MGAVFCFLLFLAAVSLCILLGQSLILAIWVGIAAFAALGLRRGMTVRAMWDAAWAQGRKMCCVIVIYMLIGAITALWRSAGTIAFFIYHGLRIITPQLFLLVTFLLTSFISYALGHVLRRGGHPGRDPDGLGPLRRRQRGHHGGDHRGRRLLRRPLLAGLLQRHAGGRRHRYQAL